MRGGTSQLAQFSSNTARATMDSSSAVLGTLTVLALAINPLQLQALYLHFGPSAFSIATQIIAKGVVGINCGGWQEAKIVSVQWGLIARFRYCGYGGCQTQSVFLLGQEKWNDFMWWGEKKSLGLRNAFILLCFIKSLLQTAQIWEIFKDKSTRWINNGKCEGVKVF